MFCSLQQSGEVFEGAVEVKAKDCSPFHSTRSGLTLIQIIIVATIVAVFTAAAVPRYMQVVFQAKVNKCRENIQQLTLAIKTYESDHFDSDNLWAELEGEVTSQHPLVAQHYIDSAPVCPITHTHYFLVPLIGPFGDQIGWRVKTEDHFAGGDFLHGAHL